MEDIKYTIVENPSLIGKGKHVRIRESEVVTFDGIAELIRRESTLSLADIQAVKTALQDAVADALSAGRRVQITGLCSLELILGTGDNECTGRERGNRVEFKNIRIRASHELKRKVQERLKQRVYVGEAHPNALSEEEAYVRLTEYFTVHEQVSRRTLESLCDLSRYKASLYLKRWLGGGKLRNIGTSRYPLYVPCAGSFGKA